MYKVLKMWYNSNMNLKQLTNEYKTIYIKVSGGADSALGLFLICKHIKENNFRPKVTISTIVEPQPDYPRNDKNAKKIVSIINDMFPGVIGDHNIHQLTGYSKSPTEFEDKTFPKYNAIKKHNEKGVKALERAGIDFLIISFLTAGPPLEIVEKNDEWYKKAMMIGPEDRFSGKKEYDNISGWDMTKRIKMQNLQPFRNLNKKDTAKLYEEHDLMETLFPYTASCVDPQWRLSRLEAHSTGKTIPCGHCYWCYEKEWAFEGLVDQPEAYNL